MANLIAGGVGLVSSAGTASDELIDAIDLITQASIAGSGVISGLLPQDNLAIQYIPVTISERDRLICQ
jgi:hypothetical protein